MKNTVACILSLKDNSCKKFCSYSMIHILKVSCDITKEKPFDEISLLKHSQPLHNFLTLCKQSDGISQPYKCG